MRTVYFEPGLANMGNPGPFKAQRNYSRARGTEASRRVVSADGTVAAQVRAKSGGTYGGQAGNNVFNVLQRVNATPRYVLQFFDRAGTQLGSTIVVNGSDLNTVASTLASNALGADFQLTVTDNANEDLDSGNGFGNSTRLSGGA